MGIKFSHASSYLTCHTISSLFVTNIVDESPVSCIFCTCLCPTSKMTVRSATPLPHRRRVPNKDAHNHTQAIQPSAAVTDPLACAKIPSTFYTFMKLPVELRLHIYSFVLPRQTTPYESATWYIRGPKGCMNILLSNRKVYKEAREIAYRSFSATIDISAWRYRHKPGKSDSGLLDRLEGFATSPLPKTLKNWQIDLHFRSPYSTCCEHYDDKLGMRYRNPSFGTAKSFTGEEVLEAAAGLARIKDLQSLKIKFPCICRRPSRSANKSDNGNSTSATKISRGKSSFRKTRCLKREISKAEGEDEDPDLGFFA